MERKTLVGEIILDDDTYSENKKPSTILRIVIAVMLVLMVVAFILMGVYIRLYPSVHGAVSSSDTYASEVGWQVLENGGNAFDAMVAMQAVLTVSEPWASGFGGGAFVTYYLKSKDDFFTIDGREEAPQFWTGVPSQVTGGASCGVPGTLHAMMSLLEKHGTWTLERCFRPAINLARSGWVLDQYGADTIEENKDKIGNFNSSRALYFDKNGQPLKDGALIKNPDLADTLERLVKVGWKDFYTGEIAKDIVKAVTETHINPGNISLEDLAGYTSVYRYPIKQSYKGYDIWSMPMPSSGPTLIYEVLNMLSNIPDYYKSGNQSVDTFINIFNALSLAYADRSAYTADADFEDVPMKGLLDPIYAAERSKLIYNNNTAIPIASEGIPPGAENLKIEKEIQRESRHTTHFSIIDQWNNVISCTSTIQNTWGNGMVVPGRGFMLNDELSDFTNGLNNITGERRPRRTAMPPFNTTIGGKRPRSTMSPLIISKDGEMTALGTPGGTTIAANVLTTVLKLIDFNMTIYDAVNSPRYFTLNRGLWSLEDRLFENATFIDELKSRGVNKIVMITSYNAGSINIAKLRKDGSMEAVGDYRKNGLGIAH